MSVFNEAQIRQAIESFQKSHPPLTGCAYDVTHVNDEHSLDILKGAVDRLVEKATKDTEMYIIMEMAKQYLNGARPTYDRATGVWIFDGHNSTDKDEIYCCSECYGKLHTTADKLFNYCPNCGAKMQGENDEL